MTDENLKQLRERFSHNAIIKDSEVWELFAHIESLSCCLTTAKTALDEADRKSLSQSAQIDGLIQKRNALARYANHMNYCATIEFLGCVDETICEIKCNCGLSDLLKGQS